MEMLNEILALVLLVVATFVVTPLLCYILDGGVEGLILRFSRK